MAASIGPVILAVLGDTFTQPARILAIIWEGATTSGDIAEISCPTTGRLLWPGRTDATQTYLGVNVGVEGINAPYGFKLTKLSSGRVLVYLREN